MPPRIPLELASSCSSSATSLFFRLPRAPFIPLGLPRPTTPSLPVSKRLPSGIAKILRARGAGAAGNIKRDANRQQKKKREPRKVFRADDMRDAQQFPLVDAMRYFRAFEVGKDPKSVKYELAVRLRTPVSGMTIKNNILLPHTVKTNMRIVVFAEGKQAEAARAAGAYLVGTDALWKEIKEGRKDFNRCIAHKAVEQRMNRSQIGRVLGPRGLMPSEKLGTVLSDIRGAVELMLGTELYRERIGVVRICIGQLGFTNQQLADNIKSFMAQLKKDIDRLSDNVDKKIEEVVLSTTNGPGISLSGEFQVIKPGANKTTSVKVAPPKRRIGTKRATKRVTARTGLMASKPKSNPTADAPTVPVTAITAGTTPDPIPVQTIPA